MGFLSDIPGFSTIHTPIDGWDVAFTSTSSFTTSISIPVLLLSGWTGSTNTAWCSIKMLTDVLIKTATFIIFVLSFAMIAKFYKTVSSQIYVSIFVIIILVCAEGSRSSEMIYMFRSAFTTSTLT